jgi:hypothetical protein
VQITGFSDVDTAMLNLCFNVGNAVGMATGGIIGDALGKRFPRFARPLVNQVNTHTHSICKSRLNMNPQCR